MHFSDPAFWRAGAISTIVVMSVVLVMLTGAVRNSVGIWWRDLR